MLDSTSSSPFTFFDSYRVDSKEYGSRAEESENSVKFPKSIKRTAPSAEMKENIVSYEQPVTDWTALHLAASQGKYKLVEFLLNLGCNVNKQDYYGGTNFIILIRK